MDYITRLKELGCKPPASQHAQDIEGIEREIGTRLPEGYRAFLAQCGGWWAEIDCACQEPTPFGDRHWINDFHNAREVRRLLDSMITPRNMVTITTGHFAKYTCLSIAGLDHGSIYALDGELRAYWTDDEFYERFNNVADEIIQYLDDRREKRLPTKPEGYNNVYLLASSFDEFLERCQKVSTSL